MEEHFPDHPLFLHVGNDLSKPVHVHLQRGNRPPYGPVDSTQSYLMCIRMKATIQIGENVRCLLFEHLPIVMFHSASDLSHREMLLVNHLSNLAGIHAVQRCELLSNTRTYSAPNNLFPYFSGQGQ